MSSTLKYPAIGLQIQTCLADRRYLSQLQPSLQAIYEPHLTAPCSILHGSSMASSTSHKKTTPTAVATPRHFFCVFFCANDYADLKGEVANHIGDVCTTLCPSYFGKFGWGMFYDVLCSCQDTLKQPKKTCQTKFSTPKDMKKNHQFYRSPEMCH